MANVKGSNSTNKMTVKPTGNPVTYSVRTDVNNNKIVTNASKETNTFAIKDNMSEYYARLSESFACGNGIINGVDYSSKYYASLSKEHAETAEEQKNAAIEAMDSFDSDVQAAKADIEQTRLNSIDSVNLLYDSILEGVESARTNAIESLDQETENNKQEINALADVIKDNADSIINRVGFNMFDTVVKDHVLTYEESKGLALQGTWVYKTAIAGERFGYPVFYNKVVEEYNEATATETVNGVTVKVHSNGHKFYDIANKSAIDSSFNSLGTAWYYGVDTANECVFLPRNNYFVQATGDASEVGKSVEAGLPNIEGSARRIACTTEMETNGALSFKSDGTNSTAAGGSISAQINFDASKSNQIYGNSNTVQPNAVKKLLYICVGNTVSDTSWVDVVTQVNGGVKDLEDKTQEGLSRLNTTTNNSIADINTTAKSYDNLTKRQITNCLLEAPQRIKYTLENGTLTIKAGSVVIVPYGTEDLTAQYPKGTTFIHENFKAVDTQFVDGKFFVWAEVQSDISSYQTSSDTKAIKRPALIDLSRNIISTLMNTTSSDTAFTGTGNNNNYRTDLNIIENTLSGAHKNYVMSFPLMTVMSDTTVIVKSIDCVFNGIGNIGSIKWLDTDVIGLATNGRNADGSLNNIEWKRNSILLKDTGATGSAEYIDIYTIDGLWYNTLSYTESNTEPTIKTNAYWWYNPSTNEHFRSDGTNWVKMNATVIGHSSKVDGKVVSFQPKQPFRAIDHTDMQTQITDLKTQLTSVVDGQWVKVTPKVLSSATATGTYTIDLSSILTTTGCQHEVLLALRGAQGSDSWTVGRIFVTSSLVDEHSYANVMSTGSDKYQDDEFATGIVPVGTDRKIYMNIRDLGYSTVNLVLFAYRRLGTNK